MEREVGRYNGERGEKRRRGGDMERERQRHRERERLQTSDGLLYFGHRPIYKPQNT